MQQAARRTVLLLFVVALLALPWAASAASPQASPRPARAILPGALDLFSQLWSFLRKAGCHIDPDGLCATKEGCNIDPNGRCATNTGQRPQTREGCNIDPDGRCATKIGCNIDPDGRCLP